MLASGVDDHRHLRRVPVVLVVFGELEIPVHLSRVGVESEQSVAIEIVAGAAFAAIRGRWISRGPENLIGGRIVSSGVPRGSAANLP